MKNKKCPHKFIIADTITKYGMGCAYYISEKKIIWLYCEKCGLVIKNEDKI